MALPPDLVNSAPCMPISVLLSLRLDTGVGPEWIAPVVWTRINPPGGQSFLGRRPYLLMWSVSDEALLAGLATGDDAAGAAFVARFQRRVFGLARVITGDERTAEDVAQEALLRAWRHAAAYDPRRGSVVTWLLTITRNLAIDTIRVRRPATIDPNEIVALSLAAGGRSPDESAEVSDELDRMRVALAGLPPEQRRAIVLAGVLGFSAREVAEQEGLPLGTAKTRIRTAMLRLRTVLVTEEPAE